MATLFHPGFTQLPRAAAPRRMGALAAVALHGLAAGALFAYEPARTAMLTAAPILVDLISAPPARPVPQPHTEPPRSRPAALPEPTRTATLPRPPIATPGDLPAPVPAAPAASAPVASVRPTPALAAAAEPAAAAPVPVTAPVFDAGYLDNPAPAYPPLSRRMHEEGRVLLRVLVTPAGAAEDVQVRTSSGAARLDAAALETVRRWKFVPAKRGADPVPAWVLIPIAFRLES